MHPTYTHIHPHTPRRPEAQTMLSPPKQEKIIKQRTVNSFPASLCLCVDAAQSPPPTTPASSSTPVLGWGHSCSPRIGLNPPWGEAGRRLGFGEATLGGGSAFSNPHFLITQGQTELASLSDRETESGEWLKVIMETIRSCF